MSKWSGAASGGDPSQAQAPLSDSDRLQLRDAWVQALDECVQADLWGQVIEAVEGFESLASYVAEMVELVRPTQAERTCLSRLTLVLRSRVLQVPSRRSRGPKRRATPPLTRERTFC